MNEQTDVCMAANCTCKLGETHKGLESFFNRGECANWCHPFLTVSTSNVSNISVELLHFQKLNMLKRLLKSPALVHWVQDKIIVQLQTRRVISHA